MCYIHIICYICILRKHYIGLQRLSLSRLCLFGIGWGKNPPFTRDKGQLEQKEVDWSRNLSAIRIVIERFIGVVK